jgi:hypothetical protein
MPMLDDYSAVVCEIPPAFLDGPPRPRDRQARDGQVRDGQPQDGR